MIEDNTIKTGLVGAGYISEFHIKALKRLPHVRIAGIFDIDQKRSLAMAQKNGLKSYESILAMKQDGVVCLHVLTPPDSHAQIALEALALGLHLYIEKPLATDVDDCRKIMEIADSRSLLVCVGHSELFDPGVRRIFQYIEAGKLGKPVSVDILRSSTYPSYPGGPLPPQYREGGYPFRDLGIHALYIIQSILGQIEDVEARWESLGGDPNLFFDEWRTIVKCKNGLGQFQLSWNVHPLQNQIIVQGTKGVLRSDLFLMMDGLRSSMPVPKPAERIINAATDILPSLVRVPMNVFRFATGKILHYHGLQTLVGEFYKALEKGAPAPVSVSDAVPVVKWTERVAKAADLDKQNVLARENRAESVPFLVTGASGALGGAIVDRLLAQGHKVRIFCRKKPKVIDPNVEVVLGDLGDPLAVQRAVKGAQKVIHAGAAMNGGWVQHQCATVIGTSNVAQACRKYNVSKLVHISSMSVVDWAGSSGKDPVSETTPLEPRPLERGAYTRAKLEAEDCVSRYCRQYKLPAVILRPGQIFGGKIPLLTPAVARKTGPFWLVLGDGQLKLPLVYIDDVVDAVLLAADNALHSGEIIQIIDDNRILTQDQVLEQALTDRPRIVHLPRSAIFTGAAFFSLASAIIGKKLPVSLYRFKSALARLDFQSHRASSLLGWTPTIGVDNGIKKILQHQAGKLNTIWP